MTREDEMALAMVAADLKRSKTIDVTACELCGEEGERSVICSCSGIYCEWCVVEHRRECEAYIGDVQADIEYDLWEEGKL